MDGKSLTTANAFATTKMPASVRILKGLPVLRLQASRYIMTMIKVSRKLRILFCSVSFVMSLSSCSPVIQKSYVATSPNLNCFERKNEKNVKLSLFVNHYEIQSNVVLTRKFGLSAGINGGFKKQIGGEIAGIYYTNIDDKNYLEIQSGYGYFKNQSEIERMPWDLGGVIAYGKHYSQNSNTIYHKVFIQPTYFRNSGHVKFGFALKISVNYFDRYHYFYSIHDDSKGDYNYQTTYSNADFRYKWNFAVEPAVKFEFRRKLFIQLSTLFSTNAYNSIIYITGYSGINREEGQLKNPQHCNFLVTIGYEFKFGKKKEK